jgi:hypothetical protein
MPIDEDSAFAWVVESGEQVDYRAFSRACLADNREFHVALQGEVDVL